MRGEEDSERLDALRQRLYERGSAPQKRERSQLQDEKKAVPTSWNEPKDSSSLPFAPAAPQQESESTPVTAPATDTPPPMSPIKKKRSYRFKLLLAGLIFFVAAVGLSSLFIIFGGNEISGENIEVSITGPFTIGGGEVLPLQIGVTNENNVPIQSATLIIEYPPGTQSADDDDRELFTERIPLDVIEPGETVNIPVRAQVFGEENSDMLVRASVEYRVRGSNATFFKEAEPLTFKISSSPVIINVDAVRNLSSGQETDVTLTVTSNAPETLRNLLIKADYPGGFDFTSSSPSPISSQNVWTIDELEPEGSTDITIRGVFLGSSGEEFAMNFSIGVPNERDALSLASIFSAASAEFTIEDAFLDVGVIVNNVRNSTASIEPGDQSNIAVEIENTLEDAIYDAVIELKLSGNALADAQVLVNNGFYNSNTQTITWDISSSPNLEQILPGDSERFSFTIRPDESTSQTPQINLEAAVKARRVSESNVQEQIVGTVSATLKIESNLALRSETGFNVGSFNDSGPVPPIVGESTSYTISWQVVNGSNSISDTAVSATLPTYASWLGNTAGGGSFNFNPSTRVVEWNVGSLNANAQSIGSFQVSILPSQSQIGKTPTLVGEQNLRANDDFTGTVVRTSESALTTEMSEEAGYSRGNGTVEAN